MSEQNSGQTGLGVIGKSFCGTGYNGRAILKRGGLDTRDEIEAGWHANALLGHYDHTLPAEHSRLQGKAEWEKILNGVSTFDWASHDPNNPHSHPTYPLPLSKNTHEYIVRLTLVVHTSQPTTTARAVGSSLRTTQISLQHLRPITLSTFSRRNQRPLLAARSDCQTRVHSILLQKAKDNSQIQISRKRSEGVPIGLRCDESAWARLSPMYDMRAKKSFAAQHSWTQELESKGSINTVWVVRRRD
ncbi:hypothetical protein PMZ80_008759 [Knufia obscura]|uniref:Uncharacterized protein n=2 Tax=Knufia TaxID=430999 RepID=A0AAN8I5B6_9EURO|nr:hypothetical protein PMZ80_008759 [Knufia obscura]KAK5955277.1 hypothetical protein OHC33_003959 [Knufia fluminis]